MKDMRIANFLSAVIFILLLLISCGSNSNNTLAGKWVHDDVSGEGEYKIYSTLIFTFNEDGTGIADFKASGDYISPVSKQMDLTYSEEGDTLFITYIKDHTTMKNIIKKLDDSSLVLVGLGENNSRLDFKKIK